MGRSLPPILACLAMAPTVLLASLPATAGEEPPADEQVLVLKQDYNILRQDRDGAGGKDVCQTLYLTRDALRIDEFGRAGDAVPAETSIIDFKTKTIIDLNHADKTLYTESFARRLERIAERTRKVRRDLDNMPAGPQKDKVAELWRGLLDEGRAFRLRESPVQEPRTVAGVTCERFEVEDANDSKYTALRVYVHPTEKLPYDSAEVLYLLQIIGPNLRNFLNQDPTRFRRVPMDLELDLATGGHLHSKVTEVKKVARGSLARDFFAIPEGYREKPTGPVGIQPD